MARLTIIKESKAARCEICHQSDRFDAATNNCARCGNLDNIRLSAPSTRVPRYPADSAYRSQQVVIPKNVTIEELGDTFMVEYNSGSFNNALPLMVAVLNLINFWPWSSQRPLVSMVAIISLAVLLLGIVSLFIRKTYLTITEDKIVKRDWPSPCSAGRTINIKKISNVELSNERGRNRLNLILNNGKSIKLISTRGDRDGVEFVERVLKERLAKKR